MYTNIFSCIVFAAMAVLCLVAGFHNPVHFIFAALCIVFVVLSLFDSSDGDSLYDKIKELMAHP